MAFQAKDLSVLAYANGFTLWHYTSIDAANAIDAANYFDTAAGVLRVGDMILADTDTDGSRAGKMFFVTGNDGSAVSVGDMT